MNKNLSINFSFFLFFFFKQKTAYEIMPSLVGSEMCIRDRAREARPGARGETAALPSLGLIATGTGGDFGRALGIAHRAEDYLAAVAGGHERAVDVGLARFTGSGGRPAERYWICLLYTSPSPRD